MASLESNKTIARNLVEALGELNAEKFLGLLTDDVMFETPGQFPGSGVKTKAQVTKEFPPMRSIFPNGIKFKILTVTAEDDRVHMELMGEARTSDGFDYNNRYHYAMVMRGDKICSFRDYLDSDLVMRVMIPAMARHGMTISGT